MPTAVQLSVQGELKIWPHKLALGKPVVRNIYISKGAETWIREKLKQLDADKYYHGVEMPREQLVDVFRRVMTGEQINKFPPKTLIEHPDWIHELRTADLRIFGWFWRRNDFIVAAIGRKEDLALNRVAYQGFLETCRHERDCSELCG